MTFHEAAYNVCERQGSTLEEILFALGVIGLLLWGSLVLALTEPRGPKC